jgi:signal peptidase complex subunit 2
MYYFRYDPTYILSIAYYDGKTKKTYSAQKTSSAADFFDENGSLCMDLYEPEVRKLHDSLLSEKKTK